MKTEFELDSHLADFTGSTISIVGHYKDNNSTYVKVQLPNLENLTTTNTCLFLSGKDLERFAVNILKSLGSKKLK